ncbi:uncharacterized protein CIMG_13385 [Coccidioides immitis RS]|uniref:Uncharacterized protein n=1 Tax=Coccidioides immitis (strain RS) TaxID=246410 RepID=A0A0D8JVS3_COCIM|nr:uncharacterized protein CIMG_13385 [Coccidioides immitis RS]KJF61041.1 hypothetical protein CIMG_13385 [Coccidioides immitis RS]
MPWRSVCIRRGLATGFVRKEERIIHFLFRCLIFIPSEEKCRDPELMFDWSEFRKAMDSARMHFELLRRNIVVGNHSREQAKKA